MAESAQSNGTSNPIAEATSKVAEIALEAKPETSKSEGATVQAVEAKPVDIAKYKEQFKAFAKFGDLKSDGKHITLSQSDKWMKQAKVIDKKITTTDTGIHFKKLKSMKVSYDDYSKFLDDLAKTRKVDLSDIKNKMADCGAPGALSHNATSNAKAAETVARLTDTSRYTGSHRQRFDETGKGKGMAGRKDVTEKSGYVSGYQHNNTYDKTH